RRMADPVQRRRAPDLHHHLDLGRGRPRADPAPGGHPGSDDLSMIAMMKPKTNESMRSAFRGIKGVTLIELMVALAIGSFLMIGAVTVFMQGRTTFRVTESIARLQENAR